MNTALTRFAAPNFALRVVSKMEWKVLQFGEFHLDAGARSLQFRSAHVPIKPREFDLLTLLASTPGEPLRRDDLVAALWPNDDVTVAALTQCVYRLRRILADCDPHNVYIVALPRRGYQFVQQCSESVRRLPRARP